MNVVILDVSVFYLSIINSVIDKGNRSLIIIFERDGGVC